MSSVNRTTFRTTIDTKYHEFTWIIDNYSLFEAKDSDKIISPKLDVGCNEEEFTLQIDKYNKTLYLYLDLLKPANKCTESLGRYKISIIKDNKIIKTYNDAFYFRDVVKNIFIVPKDEFATFVSSTDTVIIRCELTIAIGNRKNIVSQETNLVSVPKLNFDWIHLDESLSDVVLRVARGKEIPAHRVVLAAASPVFKAMFSHDMLENKSKLVDMIDVSYDAAVEMLRFVYTGNFETQELSLTAEVLRAADKYQLQELKNKCEQILGSMLSVKNVIDVLKIADEHNLSFLKKQSIDLVKYHINESSNSDEASSMILGLAQSLSM